MSALRQSMKIVVVGTGGVGKSALTLRFVRNEWLAKYDPTHADSYNATVEIDGRAVNVDILDTAGQEAYEALRERWIVEGNGFVMVYSIVDDQTLEDLTAIHERIMELCPKKVPMLLVGNKCDLEEDRVVSKEEGQASAAQFACFNFVEVSAKGNMGVVGAFESVVREIVKSEEDATAPAGGSGGVFGAGVQQIRVDEAAGNEPEMSPPPKGCCVLS